MFFVNKEGPSFNPDGSAGAFSHTYFHLLFTHGSLSPTTNLLNLYIIREIQTFSPETFKSAISIHEGGVWRCHGNAGS